MFGLMRNFYHWVKKKNEKNITLCIIGLDNAGKTTTLHRIKGDVPDTVTPTWGFSSEEFQQGRYKLTVFDLGGGKNIRGIWQNYYAEVHGFIFVVDSAALDRLEDAHDALTKALSDSRVSGKPLLILANKQDLPEALKPEDIAVKLKLHEIKSSSYKIVGCSALKQVENLHLGVQQGLQWVTSIISSKYNQLTERVNRETEEHKEKEERELEEKRKRVEALREERRKKREEEEAAAAAANAATSDANAAGAHVNLNEEARQLHSNASETNTHAKSDHVAINMDSLEKQVEMTTTKDSVTMITSSSHIPHSAAQHQDAPPTHKPKLPPIKPHHGEVGPDFNLPNTVASHDPATLRAEAALSFTPPSGAH